MKIDLSAATMSQLPAERSATQVSNTVATVSQSTTADRTTFNSDSMSVHSLASQALQTPEVRQGKVDEIRASISSGQYKIDPGKIASAILSSTDE